MPTLEEAIGTFEQLSKLCKTNGIHDSQELYEQYAEWLRELQERRKADSCEGCKHRTGGDRFWICQKCRRQYEDKYEAERRTDENNNLYV